MNSFCGVLLCLVLPQQAPKKPECDYPGRLKVQFSIVFTAFLAYRLFPCFHAFFGVSELSWRRFGASRRRVWLQKKLRKSIKQGSKKDPGLEPVSMNQEGGVGVPQRSGRLRAGGGVGSLWGLLGRS